MEKSSIIAGFITLALIFGAGYLYAAKQEDQTGKAFEPSPSAKSTPRPDKMTFFVTSSNPGKGADLGGLEGADIYCQSLAATAGAGNHTWHAYLSTQSADNMPAVNARDRIGNGPWQNYNGVVIANNLEELHKNNKISKETAITEKGVIISGRGDEVNKHDILTGSDPKGKAISGSDDTTCGNWTKSGEGAAMVGHHDRQGLRDDEPSRSWNSSHLSRGCSPEALASSGGGGLLYCFAVKP